MKKTIAIALSIILIMVSLPFSVMGATSGTTGDCTWTLDGTTLTISGNGSMGNYYSYYDSPWERNITKVIIEDGVTSIGEYTFWNCGSLTSVTISNSVTSIGYSAFSYCSSLASITIPHSVTSIGKDAFYGCTALTSVTIPDGVQTIGANTFYGCSALESIIIPDSVVNLGGAAFADCSALKTVHLSKRLTKIEYGTFNNCNNITDVYYNGTSDQVKELKYYILENNGSLKTATWHCEEVPAEVKGDMNGDGVLTSSDLALMKLTLAGISE